MGTMIRNAFMLVLATSILMSCTGSTHINAPIYIDEGFIVTKYDFIYINSGRIFEYDNGASPRAYARGGYDFISRDSVVLDARFDPLSIPYQIVHNARSLNHFNAMYDLYEGVFRCPEPQRCRLVVHAPPRVSSEARHDSLSTELFDVVGDETVLTFIDYRDWYRIEIRDTVQVTETFRGRVSR